MYDILIIGSGLSASSFLNSLSPKRRKIGIITFQNHIKKEELNYDLNNYILKNLPPRLNKKKDINFVQNFFIKNKIILDNKTSVFGSLNHGGASNYWGGSCEFLKEKEIYFLNKKNRKKLSDLFLKIYNDFKFSGEINVNENQKIKINFQNTNNIFKKIISKYSTNNLKFYFNCIAQNFKTKKILNPKVICKKKKNFEKLNFYVYKIKKDKSNYLVYCKKNKKEIILKTKKLILAAGTISTTKLVCDMLKIHQSVPVNHNPMLFGSFLLKNKIQQDNFSSSKLGCKMFDSDGVNYSSVNFRSSSHTIKKKIFKEFFIMKNFVTQKIYNYFEKNILFYNLYLDSRFSNLNLKLNKNNNLYIETNNNKINLIKNELRRKSNVLYKYLLSKDIIYPLKLNILPKMGHDNHYTGTIPINSKNKKLTLTENCELKNHKNLFIVDGSAIPKNMSKFPTGLIIANAMRIGRIV